jgi:ubiquinone/menaquinone biosynthesis C-methylase UbiE
MNQTPVHENHNPDLLRLMPPGSVNVLEFGCSSGALAREYKKINPGARHVGVEISSEYARLAMRYCDDVLVLDADRVDESFFDGQAAVDCWVFGDVLEHLRDPWRVLRQIRRVIGKGCVVACIPNAQHWSVQARLCAGSFTYEDSGLMDRTHLRWFTRQTVFELFQSCGFKIEEGFPRVFEEPQGAVFVNAIREMARAIGLDPVVAARDCMPLQYVVRAVPV